MNEPDWSKEAAVTRFVLHMMAACRVYCAEENAHERPQAVADLQAALQALRETVGHDVRWSLFTNDAAGNVALEAYIAAELTKSRIWAAMTGADDDLTRLAQAAALDTAICYR